jgi:hypothetical protein
MPVLPRLVILAGIALGGLAACTDAPPPRPNFGDIHVGTPPIRLRVAAVDIVGEWQPSFHEPEVDHLFPVPPGRAIETWVHDRLIPAGGYATARFVIRNASATETALPRTAGIQGAMTNQATERYDVVADVRLDIIDATGRVDRSVNARVARSETLLENLTPNQRDQAWYDMTRALVTQLDQQLETEIRNNLGPYIVP